MFFKLNGYIPMMQYDARCRGFQHYAGLINNSEVGCMLGIDGPITGDLYTAVFEK